MTQPANPMTQERRVYKRASLLLNADLADGRAPAEEMDPAIVLDLSATGAKIRRVIPLGHRTKVTLALAGKIFFDAEVVWEKGHVAGLKFHHSAQEIAQVLAGLLPPDCLTPLEPSKPAVSV